MLNAGDRIQLSNADAIEPENIYYILSLSLLHYITITEND